jgi:2-phosphosulfolactate phosphatase
VCAGAIAHPLNLHHNTETIGNDELVSAIALFTQWQGRLLELLQQASHGKRLLRLNAQDDLKYCSQLDALTVLPMQQEPGVLKKH